MSLGLKSNLVNGTGLKFLCKKRKRKKNKLLCSFEQEVNFSKVKKVKTLYKLKQITVDSLV